MRNFALAILLFAFAVLSFAQTAPSVCSKPPYCLMVYDGTQPRAVPVPANFPCTFTVPSPGTLPTATCTATTGPAGPQGPAGATGTQGATGPAGPQGPAGSSGTPAGPTITASVSANGQQIVLAYANMTAPPLSYTLPTPPPTFPTSISVTGTPIATIQIWIGMTSVGVIHVGLPAGFLAVSQVACAPAACAVDNVPYPSPFEFPIALVNLASLGSPATPAWIQLLPLWTGAPLTPMLMPIAHAGQSDKNMPGIEMASATGGGAVVCIAYNQ